jgi:oxidoreductase
LRKHSIRCWSIGRQRWKFNSADNTGVSARDAGCLVLKWSGMEPRESEIQSVRQEKETGKKEPIRIAVVGTGWIAEQIYLPCLLDHGGIEVAAADDPSPEVLTRFAQLARLGPESLGLPACFSQEIDGLLLCTPPSVHAQQIAQSVLLDKYVLCEKPVFRNTAELEKLGPFHHVAQRLMGSASMRLRRDVALVLRWVTEGAIGRLEHVRLGWWREKGVPGAGSWRTDPELSPLGVMEDLGPHLFDLLAALVSRGVWKELRVSNAVLRCRYGRDPRRSAAWFKTEPATPYVVPDQAHAILLSDTGTKVEVEVCWANDVPGDFCELWFKGTKGIASFRGLLGLSTLRRSQEQVCRLEIDGQPPEVHHFPTGPEMQKQAFARSVHIFAGFSRQICHAAADFNEIRRVTEWLTEIQQAATPCLFPHQEQDGLAALSLQGEIK